jgi:PAS domain S-box-containing protein
MSQHQSSPAPHAVPEIDDRHTAGYRRVVVVGPDARVRSILEAGDALPPGFDARGVHIGDLASSLQRDPARRAEWERRIEHARTTGAVTRYVDPIPAGDGEVGDVETSLYPVCAADGAIEAFVIEVLDHGVALRAEHELRVSEARFRTLAEALPQMVWVASPEHGVEYFSPRWSEFTGRPPDELLGSGYADLVHPDDRAAMEQLGFDGMLEQGGTAVFRMRRHDDEWRWMEAFATAQRDASGRIVTVIGGTTDITDRRLREDAEAEFRSQLQTALAVTGLGRWVLYPREQRLTCDARLSEIHGFDAEERMRQEGLEGFFRVIHAEDRDHVRQAIERSISEGVDYDVEYRVSRPGPNGPEEAWVAVRGRTQSDDDGPWRVLGVAEDITERKRQETLRDVAQRRETLGALVGGIAHDFNNLIAAISGNARLAEQEIAAGLDPAESLREVRRGAEHATDLVRRMLDYSRDHGAMYQPIAITDIVSEALSLLGPTLPSSIAVAQDAEPEVPPVLADRTQLLQVFVNLITNAVQAIGEHSGHIRISVHGGATDRRGQRDVVVEVIDDGPGMLPPIAERAFEPFFTTKPAGAGSGLGLAAVRTIARAHGGDVRVETAPAAGARFVLTLPAAPTVEPSPAAPYAPEELRDEPRVLFVDDEHALARLAQRALPLHGLVTTVFSDPLQAAAAFTAEPDAFALLITDQTMPGLTGLELVERLRAIRPQLPVILSSGYLTAEDRERAAALGVDAVLPKPCALEDIVAASRRLLARAAGTDADPANGDGAAGAEIDG